ncbi:MAG: hypothetical protein ACRDJS_02625 [Actinomycetota bacterium]
MGAFVMSSGGGVFALEIKSLTEAFEHPARLDLGEGYLKYMAGPYYVAITQGTKTFLNQGGAHVTMMA